MEILRGHWRLILLNLIWSSLLRVNTVSLFKHYVSHIYGGHIWRWRTRVLRLVLLNPLTEFLLLLFRLHLLFIAGLVDVGSLEYRFSMCQWFLHWYSEAQVLFIVRNNLRNKLLGVVILTNTDMYMLRLREESGTVWAVSIVNSFISEQTLLQTLN